MNKRARRRQRLIDEDPHCCYCGVEVVWFNPGPEMRAGEPLPDNFATLEHATSRVNGPRPAPGVTRLACKRCNEERGRADEAALGIEEIQRRSQRPERVRMGGSWLESATSTLEFSIGDLFRNWKL